MVCFKFPRGTDRWLALNEASGESRVRWSSRKLSSGKFGTLFSAEMLLSPPAQGDLVSMQRVKYSPFKHAALCM